MDKIKSMDSKENNLEPVNIASPEDFTDNNLSTERIFYRVEKIFSSKEVFVDSSLKIPFFFFF